MSRNRNDTLDIIKLFASYMVVFIHVAFYGGVGYVLDALARFAVPLFFLVSGFYSYKITPDKIKHRMFRLIRLLAFAVLVYTLFDVLYSLVKHDKQEIVLYFCEYINPKNHKGITFCDFAPNSVQSVQIPRLFSNIEFIAHI